MSFIQVRLYTEVLKLSFSNAKVNNAHSVILTILYSNEEFAHNAKQIMKFLTKTAKFYVETVNLMLVNNAMIQEQLEETDAQVLVRLSLVGFVLDFLQIVY